MPWIIVIGNKDGLDWVLKNERMAFRDTVRVTKIDPGDTFALYVTRGAFNSPTRGSSQVLALGSFASGIERHSAFVAGEEYGRTARLLFTDVTDARNGLPFTTLVDKLEFIKKKVSWGSYMRRTLVPIEPADMATIKEAFQAHKRVGT